MSLRNTCYAWLFAMGTALPVMAEVTPEALVGVWNAVQLENETVPAGAFFVLTLNEDATGQIVFDRDGSEPFDMTATLTYEVLEADRVHFRINFDGDWQPQTMERTVTVAFDEAGRAVLTSENGEVSIFVRPEAPGLG